MLELITAIYAFSFLGMEMYWLKTEGKSFTDEVIASLYHGIEHYIFAILVYVFLPVVLLLFLSVRLKWWLHRCYLG